MVQQFRRYFIKRLLYVALTIFFILAFNFLLFRVMPSDPTHILIPKGVAPGSDTFELLRHHYGLDKSLWEQFIIYIGQLFTGDFGKSFTFEPGVPVSSIVGSFLLNTIILAGTGTIISVLVGIYFGRMAAWRRGTPVDKFSSAFFLVFYCMPTFLFALLMLTVSAKFLPAWPISGAYSPDYHTMDFLSKIGDRFVHTLLPLAALVVETIATFSIIVRSSLIDVMTEDYLVTAVAKGVPARDILHKHAMPNAYLPVVTVIAMNVGWIMSGSIMIEIIFTYQGLGYLTYQAVFDQDYPVLQAAFMLEAVAVVVANFIADMMLFYLDPRVKV